MATGEAAPLIFSETTPYANVKLTLPDAIKPQADLHATLYAEEVRKLRLFIEGAQGARTEEGGDQGLPPFENQITITAATETGKLLSLKRQAYDWSGGAHPNTLLEGILWDKALKRRITPRDLFRPGADLTVLDQALCSAINAARRARVPDARTLRIGEEQGCPRALAIPFILTGGTATGKAAGLTFLINPYVVGPHAEGAYEIAIPHAVFRSLVAPAYIDEFAGNLLKSGDVTPAI